jgi:hypothetical protein
MKLGALRRLLEWRVEIDHDWSVKPGRFGRGLERSLPADSWFGAGEHLRRHGHRGQLECPLA